MRIFLGSNKLARVAYHGSCIRRAEVQPLSVVLVLSICNKLRPCAPKPAHTHGLKTLSKFIKDNIQWNKLVLLLGLEQLKVSQ